MLHCDPETLSLLALGESPSAADADHLRNCPGCRAELDSLSDVVGLVRADAAPAEGVGSGPVAPPPAVWDAIAAATGVRARPRPDHLVAGRSLPPPAVVAATPPEPAHTARERRRYGRQSLLAVAASGIALGAVTGAGLVAVLTNDPTTPTPSPSAGVVASLRLDPLPASGAAHGSAEVVRAGGGRELVVDVADLPGGSGFLEVWLIDKDVKKMIPIGVLHGGGGRFTLPEGVDLGQYPIVDISAEPLDGDPRHSGDSLLRGTITS